MFCQKLKGKLILVPEPDDIPVDLLKIYDYWWHAQEYIAKTVGSRIFAFKKVGHKKISRGEHIVQVLSHLRNGNEIIEESLNV